MSSTPVLPNVEVPNAAAIQPVAAPERIPVIDLLRGWALLGILTVNMEFFAWPLSYVFFPQQWPSPADTVVETGIKVFAQGKFYTLFSTLFGLGFSFFLLKGERAGKSALGTYVRRILVLLVVGLIHGYLIWMGDILTLYAVVAFLMLLFRKAKPKTLVLAAVTCTVLPLLFMLSGAIAGALNPETRVKIEQSTKKSEAEFKRISESALRTYPSGTFTEVTRQRTWEFNAFWQWVPFFGPGVLGMFLMGLAIGRKRYLHNAADHLPLFRKTLIIGAGLGIPLSAYAVWGSMQTSMMGPSFMGTGVQAAMASGNPLLAYAYASALLLLYHQSGWAQRLHPMVCAGRMALTNYLTQSLICTFIFYSHGLGQYGKITPKYFPFIILAIYAAQLVWSPWWLARFHFGPAEWLWRTLTYGKAQPMRIQAGPAATA